LEIKGDIQIKRTGIFDRRADQGLRDFTVTTTESLVRHSARWQYLTAGSNQDIVLPDATTLPEGWEIVVNSYGAGILTVQDNGTTNLQTVNQDEAFLFTLLDNATSDGVWHITALDNPSSAPATRFVLTHNATSDWGSPSAGYYTITTAQTTHTRGTRPMVQFYETVGSDEIEVTPDQSKFVTSSGDHDFRVPDDPDLRYAGKVIYV